MLCRPRAGPTADIAHEFWVASSRAGPHMRWWPFGPWKEFGEYLLFLSVCVAGDCCSDLMHPFLKMSPLPLHDREEQIAGDCNYCQGRKCAVQKQQRKQPSLLTPPAAAVEPKFSRRGTRARATFAEAFVIAS